MSKEIIIFNWDNTLASPDSEQLFMGAKNLLDICRVENRRVVIISSKNNQDDIKTILKEANALLWIETEEKMKKRKIPIEDCLEPSIIRIFTPNGLDKNKKYKKDNIKIAIINHLMNLQEYKLFNKTHVLYIDDDEKAVTKARENGYETLKVDRGPFPFRPTAMQSFYRKIQETMNESNSYFDRRGMVLGSIDEYIQLRDDEFKLNKSRYNTRFLGIGFGYAIEKKNAAALALKAVLLGLEKEESLLKHKGPLSQGRLSLIYKNYLAYKIEYQEKVKQLEIERQNAIAKHISRGSAYYNPYDINLSFEEISLSR